MRSRYSRSPRSRALSGNPKKAERSLELGAMWVADFNGPIHFRSTVRREYARQLIAQLENGVLTPLQETRSDGFEAPYGVCS